MTVFRFAGIRNEVIYKRFNEAFAIVSGIDLAQVRML